MGTKPSKPKEKKQHKREKPEEETSRGIVRIAGKDIRGHVPLSKAVLYVRGISHGIAPSAVLILKSKLNLPPEMKVGDLSDEQVEKIDQVLFNLQEHNVPNFMLNRRGDVIDGVTKHVIMNDLIFSNREDIEREKRMYSWKGYRHAYGQKVRGQRTRNTGRSGMAVGVLRKAILAQQKPAGGAAPAKPGAAAKPAEKKEAKK